MQDTVKSIEKYSGKIAGQLAMFVKKYFGEMLTVSGLVIFFYNILDFSYRRVSTSVIAYYYKPSTLQLITIGIALLTVGIMIMRNKDKNYGK
ncbi:MAG: hypothetical protein A3A98_03995 [Candidatus Staskawiczbacteria bacterium RIFCSPLOWO2_01_FULL_40_39]|uniref:Uncharacterized protein n=1 Tax=Candidatus Staskawiczbacteria bacterium RIFCSPHIGHO2_01_FULL_39_25 TaxID=1802202 RepID=A0A1G2HNK6_9BACT|nr:MAG: hypothetical protein A2730_03210 [Candidatus Staskawiczbacteria bacterium RIFCSPHIGHO2_01_FULL_39_25]OGZ73931.1 MAG: hypothetical protein A3A98_03995 [Candidatus Staskawiczbacteria bacterium RIFCSPLOWO2_01_FULL_40_39]OGZ76534.1 MAG: hypothetical protein A3I87_00250 [Candidatus Staskawiczbacteria bacterium RIFCSPLOWO2_02_FULL_39_8]